MTETHDTIDGLLAEFRGYSAGMPPSYHVTMSWADFRRMLDRFDAARRRERNRNFHRFATAEEAAEAWHKHEANDTGEEYCAECPFNLGEDCARGSVCTIGWLYAEAKEEAQMAKTHETIADIIAEMRGMGNYQRYSGDHARVLAGRLDAAHKRERGNAAKLREALEKIHTIAKTFIDATKMRRVTDSARLDVSNIKDLADAALATLAAPPRNCDVGTAEEQDERFHRFCVKHHTGSCAGCHNPVGDYTVANGVRECALVWAQMPYEEGGAK